MKKRKTDLTLSVKKMMENFHNDFNNGLNINEIAEKYKIDKSTIYKKLDVIAESNGVTRDYYIKHPQKAHSIPAHDTNNSYKHYTDDELENISASFDNIIDEIGSLRNKIAKNAICDNQDEKE